MVDTSINAGGGNDTFLGGADNENFQIQEAESLQVNGLTLTDLEFVSAGNSGLDIVTGQEVT